MYPGTKRKWIGPQPEVGNHLSLWYIPADNQTNKPYSFLKNAYKILQKPKHRKLRDEKYYERLIFFKFCQLSISGEIYSSHSRISPVLRQNRKKNWNKVVADGKLFLKAWSIEKFSTIAVNLVWNASVAKNFLTWPRLPGCWIYERLVTKSRHWYPLLLSPYWPSRANSAIPSISGKTHPCGNHFPTISIIFAANPIIFVFNSASRSHCLRYWSLYYTRSCIRKKKLTFENNDFSAWGDFSVSPATFYHSLRILVLVAQLNFVHSPCIKCMK